jgi:hypothetical protein
LMFSFSANFGVVFLLFFAGNFGVVVCTIPRK